MRLESQPLGFSGSGCRIFTAKAPPGGRNLKSTKKKRDRRWFISIGSPPFNPQKTCECPILEARRYERLISDPFINSQAAVARELGNNDGKGGQVMGLLKLPSEILSQPFIIRLPGRDYQTLRVWSGKEVVIIIIIACLRPPFGRSPRSGFAAGFEPRPRKLK